MIEASDVQQLHEARHTDHSEDLVDDRVVAAVVV